MTLVVKDNSNDVVETGDQDDLILSGAGNDTIDAGDGDNSVYSGRGNDTINSGSGDDLIVAGTGADVIDAGNGDNVVFAGKGADHITTGDGDDLVVSGPGDDTVDVGEGDNLVFTGRGDDTVIAGSGDDIAFTGSGDDTVSLGGGDDTAFLGSGNDEVNFVWSENVTSSNIFHGQRGCDTLQIVLTADEASDPAIIADLRALQAHIVSGSCKPFCFSSIDLTASGFEKLVIVAPVVACNDAAEVTEDGVAVVIDVLANDTDLLARDNSALNIVRFDPSAIPAGASLTLNSDNTFTFDPGSAFQELANGEVATVEFTYTVADDQGFESEASVEIRITGSNDAPVFTSSAQSGTVTENNVLEDGTETLGTVGAVTFFDVDMLDVHTARFAPMGDGYLGTFALLPVDQDGDAVGWAFTVENSAVSFLTSGETLTQLYSVMIEDGNGGTATQTVEITLVGSNEAPVITSQSQTGSVTEFEAGSPEENIGTHVATGVITFEDSDPSDVFTAFVTARFASGPGWFQLGPVDHDTKSVTWTFTVNDADIAYLPGNVTYENGITVTIDDGNGGTVSQDVQVAVTGSNGVPVITSLGQEGVITEIEDGAPAENDHSHAATGTITFEDEEVSGQIFSAYAEPLSSDQAIPHFFAAGLDQSTRSVSWSFMIKDADIDWLAEGDTTMFSYLITVDDGNGGTASQTVEITITGTNDVPEITSEVLTGSVTEIDDGVAGENGTTLETTGSISFIDADLTDSHTVSFSPKGDFYIGDFQADVADVQSGVVHWSFSLNDLVFTNFPLAEGESIVQLYDITIDDGNGGTIAKTVEITIIGSNDAPVIMSSETSATIVEIEDDGVGENNDVHTVVGSIRYVDEDKDNVSAVFVPQASDYLGSFAVVFDPLGLNTVDWRFSVNDAEIDYLAAGETLTQYYDVTIDDGNGGTVTQTVEITIAGTNDAPEVTSGVQTGNVTEIADGAPGETIDDLKASGTIVFDDVDLSDVHSATAELIAATAPTSFAFDLGEVDQTANSVAWTFTFKDLGADSLSEGATFEFTFLVTIQDTRGAETTQTVEIAVIGTNDAPEITSVSHAGMVTEIADGEIGENTDSVSTSGSLTFFDPDYNTHTTSLLAQSDDYLGSFLLGPVDSPSDSVDWTFSVNDAEINFLAADETLTQLYDVTIDDGDGGTATQTIEITIAGTNDVPEFTSANHTLSIFEIADGAAGENSRDVGGRGDITFSDADIVDTHLTSFTTRADSYLGSFSVSQVDLPLNSFRWQITLRDGEIDHLAEGEALTQLYDVTIDDGNGGTVTQTVEVMIYGANDAPVAAVIDAGTVSADTDSVVISLLSTAADPDTADDLDVANVIVNSSNGFRTVAFTVDQETGELILDPGQFSDLANGTTETLSINYDVSDGNGGAVSNMALLVVEGAAATLPEALDSIVVISTSTIDISGLEVGTVSGTMTGSDPSGQQVTFGVDSAPKGSSSFNSSPDGSFSYSFHLSAPPADTFDFTVTNSSGGAAGATVSISIYEDAPGHIAGTAGNDILIGGGDDSIIEGREGNDTLSGGAGSNSISGGAGNDIIDVGGGSIALSNVPNLPDFPDGSGKGDPGDPGEPGNNEISNGFADGGEGNDSVTGGNGDDDLRGGEGDDTIDGNRGADTILGGIGNDRLTGGEGADIFAFLGGDGKDTITDFEIGTDGLFLIGMSIREVREAVSDADGRLGSNVLFSSGDEVFLEDVTGVTDPTNLLVAIA